MDSLETGDHQTSGVLEGDVGERDRRLLALERLRLLPASEVNGVAAGWTARARGYGLPRKRGVGIERLMGDRSSQ